MNRNTASENKRRDLLHELRRLSVSEPLRADTDASHSPLTDLNPVQKGYTATSADPSRRTFLGHIVATGVAHITPTSALQVLPPAINQAPHVLATMASPPGAQIFHLLELLKHFPIEFAATLPQGVAPPSSNSQSDWSNFVSGWMRELFGGPFREQVNQYFFFLLQQVKGPNDSSAPQIVLPGAVNSPDVTLQEGISFLFVKARLTLRDDRLAEGILEAVEDTIAAPFLSRTMRGVITRVLQANSNEALATLANELTGTLISRSGVALRKLLNTNQQIREEIRQRLQGKETTKNSQGSSCNPLSFPRVHTWGTPLPRFIAPYHRKL
jgi:hypothetical protein